MTFLEHDDARNLKKALTQVEEDSRPFGVQYLTRCLYAAVVGDQLDCVRLLLDAGARPDVHVDVNGQTALIVAVQRGSADIVHALLTAPANGVDKVSAISRATALHWAAANGDRVCLRLLIDAGANLEARMASGRTPLMVAARSDQEGALIELIESGEDNRSVVGRKNTSKSS